MNVLELFQENARAHPEAAAIIAGRAGGETVLSFGELDARSRRVAALLLRDGLKAGDAVAVFVPMSPALYVILAALLRVGVLPVFADPAAAREALVHAQSLLPLRGFIGIPAACAWRLFTPELRRIAKVWVAGPFFPGATSLRASRRLPPCDRMEDMPPDAPAVLTFTSGTSGRPKGVIRSHRILAETHRVLSAHLGIAPGEIDVAVLPFVVFMNLAAGAGSLIPDADLRRPGAIDPRRLANQMRAWSPTGIVASPALLERLAGEAARQGVAFESLRRVFAGGAPVFPHVLDRLAEVAPRARVHAIYGSTEAEPIASLAREAVLADDRKAMRQGRGLPAGRPVPEVRLRILRDRFGEPLGPWTGSELDAATLPAGDAGEIVVCGGHVVAGYLGGVGDSELKIRVDGETWHRTGDAGWRDAQGRLWLLGSCKARVVDGRGCRYPLAVDAALSAGPLASRATLVRHRGRVLLVVEPRGAADEGDLVAAAREVAWAGADEVVAISRLPRDRRHDAKIDHPRLREMLEAQRWSCRVPMAGLDGASAGGHGGG